MMGTSSGSYKGGGSLSSSSNLSPLAPPFMVDKSFTRSSSTNSSMNFPELPVYGTVFDPAGPFSSPGLKFGETEPLGSAACPPSVGTYGYPGSQSSNSDVYYGVHNTGAGYDPFTYDQFPNNMPNSDGDDVAKPYYTPYVSSAPPSKDGYLGSGYDLLSGSGAAHFTSYASPPVDHAIGASSGGEYKPKWNGFWGGLSNVEPEKWTGYATSSGYLPLSDLLNNKSSLAVDGSSQSHPFGDIINNSRPYSDASSKSSPFGDVGNNINLKQGASVHQSLDFNGEGSTISDNCFDIFGGTYRFGSLSIHQQVATTENAVLQKPVLESVPHFSVFHQASGSSCENHLSPIGSYMFGCTSTTSTPPITVISQQYRGNGGSKSSAGSTFSGIQKNSMATETTCSINPSAGQDYSHQKGPQIPLGMEFQPGVVIRRPLFSSKFGLPRQKEETVNCGLDVKLTSDKTKFSPQGPLQFNSDDFRPKTDDAEVSYPIEKQSSGSDLYNPAEDSPCWKGASSNRFSPFSVSEAVAAEVLVDEGDGCKSPSPEELRKEKHTIATSDFSSAKVSEIAFPAKPTVFSCTQEDNKGFGTGNHKSYCIDLNIPDGLEYLDDSLTSTEDPSILIDQRSGSNSDTGLIPKEPEVLSSLYTTKASVVAKSGDRTPIPAQNSSGVPSNNGNHTSCFTVGDEASSSYSQSTKKHSDSKLDVNVVLRTMMKLSQMLSCYCLGNPTALTEQNSVTLNQIINNLNASMSVMVQQITPSMVLASQDNNFLKEFSVSEMVNDAEVVAADDKQARTVGDLQDYPEDDADALQDDSMTQAIKKILYDNLHEGIDQPELLYRNLWLEAEAALCVMTAKARFHSMKIEMENGLFSRVKDEENSPSPKVSSDGRRTTGLSPECINVLTPVSDHESQKSIATRQYNDTGDISVSISQHPSLNSMKLGRAIESKKELMFPFLYDANGSLDLGTTNHANDVDSDMIGYQILKSHCDDSETLNDVGKQSSNENHLSEDTSCVETHFSGFINHAHDFETPVMARYILKSRVGDSETLNNKGKQSSCEESNEGANVPASNVETSVMTRYQILKCRMESSDSQNESEQPTQGENYLNSELFSSVDSLDESQASVMARFSIIQNRINGLNSVINDPEPTQANRLAAENGTESQGWAKDKSTFMTNIFGPYPDFSEEDDVNKLCASFKEQPLITSNKLGTEILEGWYENDCSSDWEHVSKEELRRQS